MRFSVFACCFWLLASLIFNCGLLDASLPTKNVVTEIQKALKDRPEFRYLLNYMKMSDQELIAALPLTNTKGYTMFAPTNTAFMQSIPQDIGDPFFDPDMRNQVLIRHFVRRRLNKEELSKLNRLETASGEIYNVARMNGTTEIRGPSVSIVSAEVIVLDDITIFIVDYPFVSGEEIADAIRRHPYEVSYDGPFPQTPYDKLPKFPSGGYNRVPVDDKEVVKFAQFATQELSKKEGQTFTLKQIQSAGTQTFYGQLYKLVLELTKKDSNDSLVRQAVVFRRDALNETKLYSSSSHRIGLDVCQFLFLFFASLSFQKILLSL